MTSQDKIAFGYMVNAAGLYADKIAQDFGFSKDYRILPFKGLYLYSNQPSETVRTNIYPVPDLRNPLLGVHLTVTAEQNVKIGPTAIPAFWRENYKGLSNFNFNELMEILARQAGLFWRARGRLGGKATDGVGHVEPGLDWQEDDRGKPRCVRRHNCNPHFWLLCPKDDSLCDCCLGRRPQL